MNPSMLNISPFSGSGSFPARSSPVSGSFSIAPMAQPSSSARSCSGLSALKLSPWSRSEEHTSELQSRRDLVCRLLLEKKKEFVSFVVIRRKEDTRYYYESRINYDNHDPWPSPSLSLSFFFNDTATTEIYTLSLHDALPIWPSPWS